MLEEDSSIHRKNDSTKAGKYKRRRIFLFKMWLAVNDVKQDRLCIPAEFALDHSPPMPKRSPRFSEEKVKILSGTQDRVWPLTIRYNPDNSVFLLNSEWEEFSVSHEMKAKDAIHFYSLSRFLTRHIVPN